MKLKLYSLLITSILLLSSNLIIAQCNPKPIIKENKKTMKPYSLDSYTETEVKFGKKPQTIEVLFNAFSGEHYKLAFCGSQVPQEIGLKIYDKNRKAKKRTELYTKAIKPGSKELLNFEATKPGPYFIEFEVPASVDTTEVIHGCVITLIGVKEVE